MDAKRIELIEKHLAGSDSANVELHAKDFCELVAESKVDDEGLKKAAMSMAGHVGFVAISREHAAAMLAKVSRGSRGSTAGQASSGTPAEKSPTAK